LRMWKISCQLGKLSSCWQLIFHILNVDVEGT
jgi:hypothetical protein